RSGSRRDDRRRVRRRRFAALDGGGRRRRPQEAHRRAPGLRRHEDPVADRGAREALRRRGGGGGRADASDARRRRLARGARGVPGEEARVQGLAAGEDLIQVRTLADGAQSADEIAHGLLEFLDGAQKTLDIALYDLRLPGPLGDAVAGALIGASQRGVAVRLAYNVDHGKRLPPPPQTIPELVESLPVPTLGIPGVPDLMHHKYVIRDGSTLVSGSTNWTLDSWTREENVIVTVESPELAAVFTQDFEQLWTTRDVSKSGKVPTNPLEIGGAAVRPWFCPGRGDRLAHRIAKAIGSARRRVRIASPVITSGPILGTLAEVVSDA